METEEVKEVVITRVVYSHEVDKLNYSKVFCTMSDGTEKVINYNVENPMPVEYVLEGVTWECAKGICMGMWRMAIGEKKEITYKKCSN